MPPWMYLLAISLVNSSIGFNFDTDFPIVYGDAHVYNSIKCNRSYFGYSVILQGGKNPWIQIGAPRGGSVFNCKINKFELCKPIKKFPNLPECSYDDAWIGSTMDVLEENIVVCAFRLMCGSKEDLYAPGICFRKRSNQTDYKPFEYSEEKIRDLLIDKDPKRRRLYGFSQVGMSVKMVNVTTALVGLPGIRNFRGSAILETAKNHEPRMQPSNSYFGYAVAAGYFRSKKFITYAVSSPRYRRSIGMVHIFDLPKDTLEYIVESSEVGEYFGYSLAAGDLNNDGFSDLIVGAPFYAKTGYNEGRVYFFYGRNKKRIQIKQTLHITGGVSGGQFGTSVAFLGDQDKDGYGDIAVAAPYEDEMRGVVYIYRGSRDEIVAKVSQRITAKQIDPILRGFGISFSRSTDIDGNKYNDLAIGSYLSNHAVILRSRPVVDLGQNISGNKIATEGVTVMQVCLWYNGSYVPASISTSLVLEVDKEMRRLTIQNATHASSQIYKERYTLKEFKPECINFSLNVTDSKNLGDMAPVRIKITQTLIEDTITSQPVYIGNEIRDSFCKKCPMARRSTSLEVDVPFDQGCGEKEKCESNLTISANFVNFSSDEYIIGSNEEVILNITVSNSGDSAYSVKLIVTLPSEVVLERVPKMCLETNLNYIVCSLGNRKTNQTINTQLQLDVTQVQQAKTLDFQILVSTSSDSKLEKKTEKLNFISQADFSITGESEESSYSYATAKSKFSQIFKIEKIGLSTIPEVLIDINIPVAIRTTLGNISFLQVYSHLGNLGDQPIICKNSTYLDYITNTKEDLESESEEDNKVTLMENSAMENIRKQTRNVNLGESDMDAKHFKEKLEATILRLDCNSPEMVCAVITCIAGPFSGDFNLAIIKVQALLDISVFQSLMKEKNVVQLTTYGDLTVPYFQQSGNLSDEVYVETIFQRETYEPVPVWILTLSTLVAFLVLHLFTLGLIKAGFFDRKKKDELTALKQARAAGDGEQQSSANEICEEDGDDNVFQEVH